MPSKLQQYAASLHAEEFAVGCTRVADVKDRQLVNILGTIHSLTLRPRAGVPALEAEIEDGTGRMICIWLGRRAIRGISPGRDIRVSGRASIDGKVVRIFNPRYVLLPGDREQSEGAQHE